MKSVGKNLRRIANYIHEDHEKFLDAWAIPNMGREVRLDNGLLAVAWAANNHNRF